jgi:hypothetical protein
LQNDFLSYVRQVMLYKIIGSDFLFDLDVSGQDNIKKQAEDFQLTELSRLINILLNKFSHKQQGLIDQLPLELDAVHDAGRICCPQ